MRFSRFLFYLLFLAIHCVSANALASTINYKLIGTINSVDAHFSSVSIGDQWTATFSIDSAVADSSVDSQIGKYQGIVGEVQINSSVSMTVNTSSFTNTYINVGNQWTVVSPDYDFLDFNGDQSNGAPAAAELIDGFAIDAFELGIANWTGTMLSDTSLNGTTTVNTGDIEGSMFQLLSGTYEIYGYVDSILVSTVPVPASMWLFASGLFGLIGMARRSN